MPLSAALCVIRADDSEGSAAPPTRTAPRPSIAPARGAARGRDPDGRPAPDDGAAPRRPATGVRVGPPPGHKVLINIDDTQRKALRYIAKV